MTTTVFDTHAETYDSVAESALGRELRARVRAVVGDFVDQGDVVLDLGCGTGLDAAWLAPRVRSVFGVDASAAMVDRARDRCAAFDNVIVEHGDAASFRAEEPVDLVLANFGVINCVGDLRLFADRLLELLAPGGHAVLVTMARWCPIEIAIAAVTRNVALLRRRRSTPEQLSTESAYHGLAVQYASANDVDEAFGDHLRLVHSESLGLVLPPFEQRVWVEGRPNLLRRLATLDQRLGRVGARAGLGDHHIAVFQVPR